MDQYPDTLQRCFLQERKAPHSAPFCSDGRLPPFHATSDSRSLWYFAIDALLFPPLLCSSLFFFSPYFISDLSSLFLIRITESFRTSTGEIRANRKKKKSPIKERDLEEIVSLLWITESFPLIGRGERPYRPKTVSVGSTMDQYPDTLQCCFLQERKRPIQRPFATKVDCARFMPHRTLGAYERDLEEIVSPLWITGSCPLIGRGRDPTFQKAFRRVLPWINTPTLCNVAFYRKESAPFSALCNDGRLRLVSCHIGLSKPLAFCN
ncbi:hypothetical protein CEXT_381241 [Caerostris extrusa]|uniref:Uncharacterized protein n=1 Tax=Caerostris extrusa TaxID=172846 RepID=A0AAV4WT25_CAEEX|nr:hypothetical protein CEXT_381241 [Caerostris extrusa]